MSYIAPTWVNNSPPDLDAAALQDLCDTVENLDSVIVPKKADLNTSKKVVAEQASAGIIVVSASRSLALTDAGCFLYCQNAAEAITLTVPASTTVALPIGTEIEIFRGAAGAVTLVASSGVTLLATTTTYGVAEQYSSICLKMIALNIWSVQGNVG